MKNFCELCAFSRNGLDAGIGYTSGEFRGKDGWLKGPVLDYEKHDASGRNSGNSRDGSSRKKVKTDGSEEDIFIACVDGLKGLPEAIESVFPRTTVQTCVVHLVRHSLNFVGDKDRKAVAADLKTIYQAATETEALQALEKFQTVDLPRAGADQPEEALSHH